MWPAAACCSAPAASWPTARPPRCSRGPLLHDRGRAGARARGRGGAARTGRAARPRRTRLGGAPGSRGGGACDVADRRASCWWRFRRLAGLWWYERRRPPAKLVALVATLAALAVAARVLFAAVPNVQGTTDVALLSGYVLGPAPGFMVGALAALASNVFLGQGPWTPWQMVGWGAAGRRRCVLAAVSRRRAGRLTLAGACALAGLAFGAWMDLFTLVAFTATPVRRTGTSRSPASRCRSTLAHAIGNAALALAFGPAFVRVLERVSPPPRRALGRVRAGARAGRGLPGGVAACVCDRARLAARRRPWDRRSRPMVRGAGVRYLERAQNSDGGFGAAPGPGLEPADHGLDGARSRGRGPPSARRDESGEGRRSTSCAPAPAS